MDQEQIRTLAKEAGFHVAEDGIYTPLLEHLDISGFVDTLVKLAMAAEREACITALTSVATEGLFDPEGLRTLQATIADICARGETGTDGYGGYTQEEETMSNITALFNAVQQARDAWAAAMAVAVPVGTVVDVYIGAHVHKIEITRYDTRSYCEGKVGGINAKTGVGRKFHYTQIIGYPFSRYGHFGHLGDHP